GGDLFVAEADESDGSFLLLRPAVAVVTNVEADHLDFYGTEERIERAFADFCRQAETVVACTDDPAVRRGLAGRSPGCVTSGENEHAMLRVEVLPSTPPDLEARVWVEGSSRPLELRLSVPPRHNLLNATAALGVALALGLPLEDAAAAIGAY